jgi:hypothetical protein
VNPGLGRVGTVPTTPGHGADRGGSGGGKAGSSVTSQGGKPSTGAGRGTALSAPGSAHRSGTATRNLSASTPGRANPPSGVSPGQGMLGTVPTTPQHP